MKNNKLIIGALIGVAVGAIVGILFAPEKGTTSRRKIRTKSGDFVDDFKHKYNHVIDSLTSKLDDVSHEIPDATDIFEEIREQSGALPNHPKS